MRARRIPACLLALAALAVLASCSDGGEVQPLAAEGITHVEGLRGWYLRDGQRYEMSLQELRRRGGPAQEDQPWQIRELFLDRRGRGRAMSLYTATASMDTEGTLELGDSDRIRPLIRAGEWVLQADRISFSSERHLILEGDSSVRSDRLELHAGRVELIVGQLLQLRDAEEAGTLGEQRREGDLILASGNVSFALDDSAERPEGAERLRGGADQIHLRWFFAPGGEGQKGSGSFEFELREDAWVERGQQSIRAGRILYESAGRTLQIDSGQL